MLKLAMITTPTALPTTRALASANVQRGNDAAVLTMNPTNSRPALSDHLGGQVRVRKRYDDGGLSRALSR
jgi:hypothetical protein